MTGVPGLAILTIAGVLILLVAAFIGIAMYRRWRERRSTRLFVSPKVVWSSLALSMLAILALLTLDWRSATMMANASAERNARDRTLSDLRYLDEALVMSARLAVTSDDPRWLARYDSLGTQILTTLGRFASEARPVIGGVLTDSLLFEVDRMLHLERQALDRRHGDGHVLLDSPEYAAAENVYEQVIRQYTDSLQARRRVRQNEQAARFRVNLLVGLGTLVLIGLAWAGLLLLMHAYSAELVQRERIQHGAREAAESANRSKDEFLARMSHELRTPLNAVIGFANVLFRNKGKRLSATDLTYVSRIQHSGQHLLGLINEILDLARLESGRVDVDNAPVELGALVRNAIALVPKRDDGQGARLDVELPADDVWASTDAVKLTRILVNLVANAVKFTQAGTITVRLSPEPHGAGGTRITVADTGPGIPADRLEAIFQPFEQADSSTARDFGGTGLGLSISRAIANALDCTLRVESVVGTGSTFALELPRGSSSLTPPMHVTSSAPAARGRPLVLVIDDDPAARAVIASHVREADADAVLADSGAAGVRMAREQRPDAITLDPLMPSEDMLDLLSELKADPLLRSIPVIVVSLGAAGVGSLLGTVDTIAKPIERDALREAMGRHVEQGNDQCDEVLLVEPELSIQRTVCGYLRDLGVTRIEMSNDGMEALRTLEICTPQLILLDLLLPRMSGIALLRALRLDVRWLHVPVILLCQQPADPATLLAFRSEIQSVMGKRDDIGTRLPRLLRRVLNSQAMSITVPDDDGEQVANP